MKSSKIRIRVPSSRVTNPNILSIFMQSNKEKLDKKANKYKNKGINLKVESNLHGRNIICSK